MNVKIIDRPERPIETIYKAFRVCYSKDVPTKIEIPTIRKPILYKETEVGREFVVNNDKMIKFIKDKIDKGHESPLEHCNITFAIEGVSRALSHQLVRHRIASYSQQSQRYCKLDQFEYVIPPEIEKDNYLKDLYECQMVELQGIYDSIVYGLMKNGRTEKQAIEDARYIFPNACYTNLVVTMNLRTFRHFYSERDCSKAQWEIRELSNKMMKEVKTIIPFADYKAKKCGISCFECKVGE